MEGMDRLGDARDDDSVGSLSFSCSPCDSCSIEGTGESNEIDVVHSLVDILLDILISSHVRSSSALTSTCKIAEQNLEGKLNISNEHRKRFNKTNRSRMMLVMAAKCFEEDQ